MEKTSHHVSSDKHGHEYQYNHFLSMKNLNLLDGNVSKGLQLHSCS